MCKRKFLASFLTVCILLTIIGTPGVVASAEDVTVINVGQGVTYALPTTINDVEVTWTDAAGETVTNVDNSLVGYRMYTGTLADADNTTVTYRVNVGEYKMIMRDTFENYTEDQYYGEINETVDGITFYKEAYTEETAADGSTTRLMKDGSNTVLAIGPNSSNWDDVRWTPGSGDAKKGDAYRISAKVKVLDFDPSSSAGTTNYLVELRPYNTTGAQFRAKTNASDEITATEIRSGGATINEKDTSNVSIVNVDWKASQSNDTTTYSMSDYVTLSIAGNNIQYSSFFGDTEVDNSRLYSTDAVPNNGITRINISKTSKVADTKATVYIDEVTYERAVYVTDTLENVSVTTAVEKDSASAQTATAKLNMSDGTTKDFTVNFTADTSEAATGKTATGTIEGFDGTVTVKYNVTGSESRTINTYIGAKVKLADGNYADTTTFGRKYYRAEGENTIINYTVNVGDWGIKVSDDMSEHLSATFTKTDGVTSFETIEPVTADGFRLVVYNTDKDNESAVLDKDPENSENQVLKFGNEVNSDNVRWYLGDAFDGSFKVKMRVKAEDFIATSSKQALRIMIYNSSNQNIVQTGLALPASSGTSTGVIQMQTFRGDFNSGAADSQNVGNATLGSDGKYDTEWIDIEIHGNADTKTFDICANGVWSHVDWPFYTSDNGDGTSYDNIKCDIGRIVISKRTDKDTENDAIVYVDDVEIYSHKIFTDELPSGEEVLVGQNAQNPTTKINLTLSDESLKTLDMSLNDIDTSVLGTVSAQGVIAGFDDEVSVNAKVCNYNIEALGFKENGEYISAPKAGGTISDTIFTNVGDYTQGKAVFAWFTSKNKLESSKVVDLSDVAKGETKKVSVNLQLPEDIEGGKLKVFVMGASDTIMPIDITELFDSFTQTSPTVYMTGDSTTCNYKVTRFPEAGVGQMFGDYLNGASVVNMARSGLSSQTFIDNGYWDTIMNNVKPGDYIFITFGHNDLDDGTFQVNIPKFAKEADEKNANIIMYSPVARRLEAIKGTAWNGFNYGGQMDFMKAYCTDNNIPYIDMTTLSQTHIQGLSDAESTKLYMVDVYSNYANYEDDERWAQSVFNTEAGRIEQRLSTDNSHFTFFGADTWAQMLAKQIKNMNLVLSDYIVNTDTVITYPNLD